MRPSPLLLPLLPLLLLCCCNCCRCLAAEELSLRRWHARAAATGDDGAAISAPGFAVAAGSQQQQQQQQQQQRWLRVAVPATVVGALLQNDYWGEHFDPYFGDNLERVAQSRELYAAPWWFRADDFNVTCSAGAQALRLVFDGLSYRANVWVNGRQVGAKGDVAGAMRAFEFDISGIVCRAGAQQVVAVAVAVQVFPAEDLKDYDLGVYFVDWAPHPPDASMGLWRDVRVVSTGAVSVAHPAVTSTLTMRGDSVTAACLSMLVEVANHADVPVKGYLSVEIVGITTSLQQ
eukprot:TRINITY_DN1444_c0_g2_i1.p1 TRINITY_DN1444_c0_g2~~TRINITY_DN1444_c0_g2_i1.p1  ORF type:complete len:290 (-),score=101.66 TRINITY_DN1444_c0_g2_i1:324-1193(-)